MSREQADTLKEKGNHAFRLGQYAQAELLYSQAIDVYSRNHLIYNNRANARLRLQRWDGALEDCLRSISLTRQNHKAYYFLAQAQLALDHAPEAVSSALTAYEQVCNPVATARQSTKDLETFSAFVLKCKKAAFTARDIERRRRRGDLRAELEGLLELNRREECAKVKQRLEALELTPTKASDLSEDIRSTHKRKMDELKTIFLLADPTNHQPREVPDHLIDMITFEIMHDPVMTKSGHSYERVTLHEHLKRSQTDPLTREPLTIDDLRPNLALKAACDAFWTSDVREWIGDW